jgi:hypothetical protein
MTTSPPLRVGRFIAVAFCVTLAAAGLSFLVLSFPDTVPPTTFENICTYVCLVVSWPLFVVSAFMLHEDPSLVVYILLWIASGLFWAFIVELFLVVKKRMWPNT